MNMTDQEFAAQELEILKSIPEEMKSPMSYYAYERGHSAGHEEVLIVLRGLVAAFEQPLETLVTHTFVNGQNSMSE